VEALATEFRAAYWGERDVRVFSQSHTANRLEFGVNELLHDVTVARYRTVRAPQHHKDLSYIAEVLWQVESEFARNGREALFDFNKLVLGSAQHKLFVAPDVNRPDAFLRTLLAPARVCTGSVFVAIVPHPDRWGQPSLAAKLWRLEGEHWVECETGPEGRG
jgi:hypothetical protein